MISVLRMFYSVKYLIPWYVGSKKYVIPESSKEIESKSDQIYLIIKPLVSFNLGFSYLHVYVRMIRLWYQKKSTRFGHFGGFVLDFPLFIYW